MQDFISNIWGFIYNISRAIRNAINNTGGEYITKYLEFLDKNIFSSNSLIGLNITWYELFNYVALWFLVILFVVIAVKFVAGIISLFDLRR